MSSYEFSCCSTSRPGRATRWLRSPRPAPLPPRAWTTAGGVRGARCCSTSAALATPLSQEMGFLMIFGANTKMLALAFVEVRNVRAWLRDNSELNQKSSKIQVVGLDFATSTTSFGLPQQKSHENDTLNCHNCHDASQLPLGVVLRRSAFELSRLRAFP